MEAETDVTQSRTTRGGSASSLKPSGRSQWPRPSDDSGRETFGYDGAEIDAVLRVDVVILEQDQGSAS
jgi:hypothetical protein